MIVTRLISAFLFLTLTVDVSAQQADDAQKKAGKIYATAWGMTLAEDGTGFYNDLAHLVLDEIARTPRYDIVPYRRANRIFAQDKTGCHYPSTLNYMAATGIVDDTSGLVESYFMLRSVAHIFSRYDTPAVSQKADVTDRVIAYPMGAEVPRLLDGFGASFIPVNDEKGKAELLISGRVELMIAYMPDVLFVFRELGKPMPPYNPSFTINDDNIAIVCHRTVENEDMIARINARIKTLRDSGELAAFLSARGIDPTYYLGPLERKTLGH
ncbi:hypothetical protein ACFO5Q_14720 [Kordiimonas lipolytica]|uniref:Solute-binding protein family 3/N-terminal domain-containing protein n=1 Tax=Kordiimonas lipolytica TaxID=1662421 RepID=A0ABV8UEL9_9PROT|nr:hypothetical protein [Kordiimonas lipolytica]